VAGGIQIARIQGQEFPALATGGIIDRVATSGATPSGEDGLIAAQRGEAVLNRGAVTELGSDTISALNGLGSVNQDISVNVSDATDALGVFNEFARTQGSSTRGTGV